ncbi:MAG: NAD(P)H-dependent flavin oxidoreductase [Burkholderiales bacterium]
MTGTVPTDLPMLRIRGREALPVVQGGMGVGVSAHRLAGTVAREGAVGTLSSVDLRRHHPDLMEATGKSRDKAAIDEANRVALDREVKGALALAGGNGIVAVNVMRAVTEYGSYVRQSCESGAHAIVVGAGLPLDLPELTANFPDVALVPILSDARGIGVVLKKWMRKGRLPDAIVIEHPGHAGGHLGASKVEDLHDERFDFERVLEATFKLFAEVGIACKQVPLIVAGGIATPQRVRELLGLGASAVQLGTAFAVTEEGDAHPTFKKVLAEAKPEDIVEFVSVAGLPARAVKTPWLVKYLEKLPAMERRRKPRAQCTLAFDCLQACGLRDGLAKFGQFCIDLHLAAALEGNLERGLFFRGAGRLPFGDRIRPVRELLDYLLAKPAPQPA